MMYGSLYERMKRHWNNRNKAPSNENRSEECSMMEFNQEHPKVIETLDVGGDILGVQEIRDEQEKMLYQASVGYARDVGGTFTNACLDILKDELGDDDGGLGDYYALRIDTRVHMLKSGMYPCIPGWHTDFIERDENGNLNFQPERDEKVRHFALCSHQPTTEFLHNRKIEIEENNWGDISEEVQYRANQKFLNPFKIGAGDLVEFDSTELHKGTQCEESGWRYFFRATLFPPNDDRRGQYMDKRRWQTQVYTSEHRGW